MKPIRSFAIAVLALVATTISAFAELPPELLGGPPSENPAITAPTLQCPPGFSYNAETKMCYGEPHCPPGGKFNRQTKRCEAPPPQVVCPTGYTYSPEHKACVAPALSPPVKAEDTEQSKAVVPTCPEGGAYNPSTKRCEVTPQFLGK